MERVYVVAFPELGAADSAWIESIRAAHDVVGHELLGAHFTFVFGCTGVAIDVVERAARAAASHQGPIQFRLARAVSSTHGEFHYVFLCPDEGASSMIKVHESLHAGALAACVDRDQSFVPHLTVCKTPDAREAAQVLDHLRRSTFQIVGTLPALTVGVVLDNKFKRLREVPLTPAAPT